MIRKKNMQQIFIYIIKKTFYNATLYVKRRLNYFSRTIFSVYKVCDDVFLSFILLSVFHASTKAIHIAESIFLTSAGKISL